MILITDTTRDVKKGAEVYEEIRGFRSPSDVM